MTNDIAVSIIDVRCGYRDIIVKHKEDNCITCIIRYTVISSDIWIGKY